MAACELTGLPYEPVLVDLAGPRTELRSINPAGKVPTLDAGGLVITETVAIVYWLAARCPAAELLPEDIGARAGAISIMAWLGSTMHILRRQYSRAMMFSDDPSAQASIRQAAEPRYWAELQTLDKLITAGGARLSLAVQAYALLFYHWGSMDRMPMEQLPGLAALASRLLDRPEIVRALTRHNSPLLGKPARTTA